ncbi:Aste57867_21631 [Aphanomyces stellatus]|uniref:Aste57867_21631 protein n=1 Tax=Aphanomyces stellatus TaxID=120398 RepID=A0A485LMU8_9STRA|nr:hypothetical protein As57867_021562 [Aphanomyces stellatus]VFT98301.1 Aste57867_21631 [Aphanomyces stellatus]
MATACHFNGCTNAALAGSYKCEFHKARELCRGALDCRNQVYARGLCVRHGAKGKCAYADCHGNVRVGRFCSRHGGNPHKKFCTRAGCTRVAHAHQKCVAHGGGHLCKTAACATHARRGGYCQRHGRAIAPEWFAAKKPTAVDAIEFAMRDLHWVDDEVDDSATTTTTVQADPINLDDEASMQVAAVQAMLADEQLPPVDTIWI